ncbi:MAG: glycosyltransferase family 9 protein [archaeon]
MNVDMMRRIDYAAGVPLCLILSAYHRLLGRFIIGAPADKPKKVLFMELSEMGSTVLAYPAMRKVKELYPGAELYFMIFEENRESVKVLDIIPKKNIITISYGNIFSFAMETLRAVMRCRRERIDAVFDLELFARYSSILSYLTGAKARVGFHKHHSEGLYRGSCQTHKISYNPHMHISQNFLAQVYSLAAPKGEYPLLKRKVEMEDVPHIKSSRQELDAIRKKMREANPGADRAKRLVILNTHAGDLLPIRAWPIANYIGLAERLLQTEGTYIVTTGIGDAEKDAALIMKAAGRQRIIDLTNRTAFSELIALYNICDLIITNDSGPAHFASLTGIKIITLFGPETPDLYAPLGKNSTTLFSGLACSPCVSAYNHRKTTCRDNRCLKLISVDTVHKAALQQLGI